MRDSFNGFKRRPVLRGPVNVVGALLFLILSGSLGFDPRTIEKELAMFTLVLMDITGIAYSLQYNRGKDYPVVSKADRLVERN